MTTSPRKPVGPALPTAGLLSRRSLLAASGLVALPWISRARAATPSLKLGMANPVMTVVYPYVTNAQAMGFFAQEGVNVDVVMGQGSPQILSLLVAGTVDMVFCNPEPVIQLHADRSLPIKSVFTVLWNQYMLAVPEDSAIKTVADLKGKRVGMFSPQSGIDYLKARLQDAGLTVNDITIVPTSFGGQTMVAVRQKQVDAILYWSDALLMMRYAGLKLRDLPKADWEKGLYQYVAATTTKVIDEKADALTRTLRAMAQGQMMSAVSPQLTVEAFWKQHPDQAPKPEAREKALKENLVRVNDQNLHINLPPHATKEQLTAQRWGDQSLAAWTRMQDNLFRVGSLKHKVDPNQLFDARFIGPANEFDRGKLFARAK